VTAEAGESVARCHRLASVEQCVFRPASLRSDGDALWVSEIARILHDGLGAAGKRVPTHEIPNVVVRLLGLFNPSVRPMVHDLGVFKPLSNEKARSVLGWQPRSAEDALIEMGESLLQRGVINH
jgi:nucleoside-diphosphate-sugar epimerase